MENLLLDLRNDSCYGCYISHENCFKLHTAAADEIERLRAEIIRLTDENAVLRKTHIYVDKKCHTCKDSFSSQYEEPCFSCASYSNWTPSPETEYNCECAYKKCYQAIRRNYYDSSRLRHSD